MSREPNNTDRAAWADAAIQTFIDETGTDQEAALVDLLADLMHWADEQGQDFDNALLSAEGHYSEEVEEEK